MHGADPRRPFRPVYDPQADHGPKRDPRPGEVALQDIGLDPFARLTLVLLRSHFQTFAVPESQGWLIALRCATAQVGPDAAGALCYDLLGVVQTLRSSRTTPIAFNAESCPCCRDWLTPAERQIMQMIAALRHNHQGRARTLAQLLCDGAPDSQLLAVTETYLRRNAPDFAHGAAYSPA
ncbi:hypothetical protein [Yoonia vestfoldensis]|uniref:Uncharacterized protein n=1 Tax=Yoonia vestfoldensis TaxID=245188 RepID=A0A1Y0EEQ9_9RHOB|nr:hypothetical protein [Yoonia vestfoldensis]ARU01919.1 hypothetical protein LOKVESSMR4R_02623 [Yoonia vestfoldensis]